MTRLLRPGRPAPDYFAQAIDRGDTDDEIDFDIKPKPPTPRPGMPRPGGELTRRPGSPIPPRGLGILPRPGGWVRPGYTPPVRHEHGNRRQEEYRTIDRVAAIREQEVDTAETYASAFADRWRRMQTSMSLHEPTKRTMHVTKDRRVQVFDLARVLGLTSAQTILLLTKRFDEYVACSSSSVASIVATQVITWAETDEGKNTILLCARGGDF